MKPIDTAALADPTHPAHHFSLGQAVSLLLLGLAAYKQQDQSDGPSVFLDPATTGAYLQGILSVIHPSAE